MNEESVRVRLGQKGCGYNRVKEIERKERKVENSATPIYGIQTHDLLLSGQAHYHCAKGEAASGR